MERADLTFTLRAFAVGIWVTLATAVASAVYLLATPAGPNRGWLLLLTASIAADAVLFQALPRRKLALEGRATLLWCIWLTAHVVGVALAASLDSPDSPYVGLFWVLVAFAAVCLPRLPAAAITVAALIGIGVVTLVHTPADEVAIWPMLLRLSGLLAIAAVCSTLAVDRARQVRTLEHHNEEIVQRLALVVEHRDHDTGGHVDRIGSSSAIIARELGFDAAACERLRLASTLHDVGKVGIPDEILLKPGALTADERRVMERHAQIGFDMLSGSGIDVLDAAAEIALTHHEKYDGSGYPRGLSGTDIPLAGRIVAVADVFDALTSDRVYKDAMDWRRARDIVVADAGSHFDPLVVAAFERRIDEIRALRTPEAPAYPPAAPVAVAA